MTSHRFGDDGHVEAQRARRRNPAYVVPEMGNRRSVQGGEGYLGKQCGHPSDPDVNGKRLGTL